ncbi:hypothetical protein MMC22_011005, partial [Lobaria immixta]|nr:hypothetical protein [Lobaria immixta]
MAAVSHDHTNYQARLDYIPQLLVDHLGLSSKVGKQEGKHVAITIIATSSPSGEDTR